MTFTKQMVQPATTKIAGVLLGSIASVSGRLTGAGFGAPGLVTLLVCHVPLKMDPHILVVHFRLLQSALKPGQAPRQCDFFRLILQAPIEQQLW